MKEINSLLNFISETTQSKYNFLFDPTYKNNIFIRDQTNEISIDLSKSFYESQKTSFNKEIIFGFSFEIPYLNTTIEDTYSWLFFDLNQIFKNSDKELINFSQQLSDLDSLSMNLHIITRIPISFFIFNYIDQNKIKERNVIKDEFEYLLYKFISDLNNFNQRQYRKYLSSFTALYYIHFILQAILIEIINLFLSEKLEKIDLKKNFELNFYYSNFLSKIDEMLEVPEPILLKFDLRFMYQFIKKNIHQFFMYYLKLIDFKKILNDGIFLKNKINKYKINSLIDLINTIDIQIQDNLIIKIEFNKFKKYFKNSEEKISFKRKKL